MEFLWTYTMSVPVAFAADEIIVTSSSNLCGFANEVDGKKAGGKDQKTLAKLQDWLTAEFNTETGLR